MAVYTIAPPGTGTGSGPGPLSPDFFEQAGSSSTSPMTATGTPMGQPARKRIAFNVYQSGALGDKHDGSAPLLGGSASVRTVRGARCVRCSAPGAPGALCGARCGERC